MTKGVLCNEIPVDAPLRQVTEFMSEGGALAILERIFFKKNKLVLLNSKEGKGVRFATQAAKCLASAVYVANNVGYDLFDYKDRIIYDLTSGCPYQEFSDSISLIVKNFSPVDMTWKNERFGYFLLRRIQRGLLTFVVSNGVIQKKVFGSDFLYEVEDSLITRAEV